MFSGFEGLSRHCPKLDRAFLDTLNNLDFARLTEGGNVIDLGTYSAADRDRFLEGG